MWTRIRDWISCLALVRAFGRDRRHELSPEQAAKILGISRPMVYHRMDSGRLPFRIVGTHRRVHLEDVLKLREFERRRREVAKALAEDTEELEALAEQERQSASLPAFDIDKYELQQDPGEADGEYAARRKLFEDDDTTIRGSDDFLASQGIADPEEFRVKTHLCNVIALVIEDRGLTEEQAAEIAGQTPSDIARIVNSRFGDYSVWRLMKVAAALGGNILIVINPAGDGEPGIIMSQSVDASDDDGA